MTFPWHPHDIPMTSPWNPYGTPKFSDAEIHHSAGIDVSIFALQCWDLLAKGCAFLAPLVNSGQGCRHCENALCTPNPWLFQRHKWFPNEFRLLICWCDSKWLDSKFETTCGTSWIQLAFDLCISLSSRCSRIEFSRTTPSGAPYRRALRPGSPAWKGSHGIAAATWGFPSNGESTKSSWWFEPLWKILVNWDYYSQYMGK